MKLRNKKTGEIVNIGFIYPETAEYFKPDYSLADFTKEWEDYEEPTGYWYIDFDGEVLGCVERFDEETEERRKEIGNYFGTREEAEKAVEKLKAWKRLKDKGFKFEWWLSEQSSDHIEFYMDSFEWDNEATKDLDLLFGSGDLEAKDE